MNTADKLYNDFCNWLVEQRNQYNKGNDDIRDDVTVLLGVTNEPVKQLSNSSRHLYIVHSLQHSKAKME